MSDAALSKSLDDLIKEQRKTKNVRNACVRTWCWIYACVVDRKIDSPPLIVVQNPKPKVLEARRPPLKSPAGGSQGGGRGGRRGKERGKVRMPTERITVTVAGAVSKHTRAPRRVADPELKNPDLRAARLEGPAKWSHDMFKHVDDGRPRGPRAPSHLGTKLFVSNLDYKVSSEDIKELFETVGPLASHTVHFDRSGRSEGTAEAVFRNREDAEKAQRKYNGIQLDGQAMKIEIIEKAEATEPGMSLKSGIKVTGTQRIVKVDRNFNQAMAGAISQQPRGRGAVRSRVVAMDI